MELLILAAGMGSRYGGLKQIEPIDEFGNFIIDYSIYDAIQAGFKKVILVIKEENYDDFYNTIGKRIKGKIEIEYVFQKTEDIPIKDEKKDYNYVTCRLCCVYAFGWYCWLRRPTYPRLHSANSNRSLSSYGSYLYG
jgi:hypothetical protein